MSFTRKDFFSALFTGLTAGLIGWLVLDYLAIQLFEQLRINTLLQALGYTSQSFGNSWLLLLVPLCWMIGVWLGYFLGRWIGFFTQFGRYAAIGFTNFAVDAGVFNLLSAATEIKAGLALTGFKAAGFVVANLHSYFWNRRWAFQSADRRMGREVTLFGAVSILGLLINAGTFTLWVNYFPQPIDLELKVWHNLGAIAGSAVALIFSFVGFRILVFRKSHESSTLS